MNTADPTAERASAEQATGQVTGQRRTERKTKVRRGKAAAAAIARSYRAERVVTAVFGFLALLAGIAALVVGFGWLGEYRAGRPLLDPVAVDWLSRHAVASRVAALVAGLLLVVAGLWWSLRCLRPEVRPDLELDGTAGAELTVTADAIAEAVRSDAERVRGVTKARARTVGSSHEPALRLSLWLREGTNVKSVWHELDNRVLSNAREALGVESLPTAVWLELDAGERKRVE